MIKTTIIATPHSLPLTFCFWRKADSTAPAISGMAFRLFSTSLTNWLKSFRCSCHNAAMFYLMAILAKSNAVRYFISQILVGMPFLDVMGVYRSRCAALLAGKIITFKNRSNPLFIFISPVPFRIRNLCGFISTSWAAIFRFWMPTSLLELRPTKGAYSHRGGVSNLIAFTGAIGIRRISNLYNKILPADGAGFCPASITEHSFWLATCKWLAARLTNGRVNLFMTGLVKTNITKIISTLHRPAAYLARCATRWTSFGIVSDRLKFIMATGASFHALIIHFLQRMSSTITGIKSCMTDAFPNIEIKRLS